MDWIQVERWGQRLIYEGLSFSCIITTRNEYKKNTPDTPSTLTLHPQTVLSSCVEQPKYPHSPKTSSLCEKEKSFFSQHAANPRTHTHTHTHTKTFLLCTPVLRHTSSFEIINYGTRFHHPAAFRLRDRGLESEANFQKQTMEYQKQRPELTSCVSISSAYSSRTRLHAGDGVCVCVYQCDQSAEEFVNGMNACVFMVRTTLTSQSRQV